MLRGLLQGAIESPSLCVLLLDTLVQVMELKVVGAEWWGGQDEVSHLNMLVFIDDGVNAASGDARLAPWQVPQLRSYLRPAGIRAATEKQWENELPPYTIEYNRNQEPVSLLTGQKI